MEYTCTYPGCSQRSVTTGRYAKFCPHHAKQNQKNTRSDSQKLRRAESSKVRKRIHREFAKTKDKRFELNMAIIIASAYCPMCKQHMSKCRCPDYISPQRVYAQPAQTWKPWALPIPEIELAE